MVTFEKLGAKIKDLRESKRLSQKELSEILSKNQLAITRETVSKIESGKRVVNAIELRVIAKILGTTSEVLLGEEVEEEEVDLVGLCRRNGDIEVTEEVEWALDDLWYFMTSIVNQKKLYKGEIQVKRNEPNWV